MKPLALALVAAVLLAPVAAADETPAPTPAPAPEVGLPPGLPPGCYSPAALGAGGALRRWCGLPWFGPLTLEQIQPPAPPAP